MSKVKVAVAWSLPDEEALGRGDAQAVQGDVDNLGLANEKKTTRLKRRSWCEEGGER